MKHNQKGFSAVEAIIIVVVIVILGLGGWYVWKSNNKKEVKAPATSQQESKDTKQEPESDPTANWTKYSNAEGNFSFKYPSTWLQAANPTACMEGLVLLAPVTSSLGKCASEHGGQIGVSSSPGDMQSSYDFKESYYKDVTETSVIVEGVTGKKLTTTVQGMDQEVFVGSYPDGTKLVRYTFVTNNRTYVATYTQQPTYPDVLSDFTTLVTKTLKFSK